MRGEGRDGGIHKFLQVCKVMSVNHKAQTLSYSKIPPPPLLLSPTIFYNILEKGHVSPILSGIAWWLFNKTRGWQGLRCTLELGCVSFLFHISQERGERSSCPHLCRLREPPVRVSLHLQSLCLEKLPGLSTSASHPRNLNQESPRCGLMGGNTPMGCASLFIHVIHAAVTVSLCDKMPQPKATYRERVYFGLQF